MSEAREKPVRPARRLSDAIRDAKNIAADRDDVVVDMREASRIRLEILAAELEDVFAEVPAEDSMFDFAISSGLQPRLWIDAVAHVAMGRDKRSYRFVRDSRAGRVVLAETHDVNQAAEAVTRYIAERVVERERLLDGSVEPLMKAEPGTAAADAGQTASTGSSIGALLLGSAAAAVAIALIAYALKDQLAALGIQLP